MDELFGLLSKFEVIVLNPMSYYYISFRYAFVRLEEYIVFLHVVDMEVSTACMFQYPSLVPPYTRREGIRKVIFRANEPPHDDVAYILVMVNSNPLFIQRRDVDVDGNVEVLETVIEEDWEAYSLRLVELKSQSGMAGDSWIYLHEEYFARFKVYREIESENSSKKAFFIEEVQKLNAVFRNLPSNPPINDGVLKIIFTDFISAVASLKRGEFLMTDEFRHQWANDGPLFRCNSPYCERFQPSVRHDFKLPSVLQDLFLFCIVFLIEDKESATPTKSFLVLNANLICFKISCQFQQMLIAFNCRSDIRDKRDTNFDQQINYLNFVAQIIVKLG